MRSSASEAKARVLAAARHEFAENGLAGARIDRISAEANVSKERLYVYFGSKRALWTELMIHEIGELDAVGSVESLDGAAIVSRLYEQFVEDPEQLRLFYWQLVEIAEEWPTPDPRTTLNEVKIKVIARAQGDGRIGSQLSPELVVRLLITVAANSASEFLAGKRTPARRKNIRLAAAGIGSEILSLRQ
jgi:AcrR family transcriptional regulator